MAEVKQEIPWVALTVYVHHHSWDKPACVQGLEIQAEVPQSPLGFQFSNYVYRFNTVWNALKRCDWFPRNTKNMWVCDKEIWPIEFATIEQDMLELENGKYVLRVKFD